jgi:hypothetical protein
VLAFAVAQESTSAATTTTAAGSGASTTEGDGKCTVQQKADLEVCNVDLGTCLTTAGVVASKKCDCFPTYFACIEKFAVRIKNHAIDQF